MLHNGAKDQRGGKWDGERIGHNLIVLLKGILPHIKLKGIEEVPEKDKPHIVRTAHLKSAVLLNLRLIYYNGILALQVAQIGKCRAKHRVNGDISESRCLIELLQPCLYRGNIGDYAVLWQMRHKRLKGLNCVT